MVGSGWRGGSGIGAGGGAGGVGGGRAARTMGGSMFAAGELGVAERVGCLVGEAVRFTGETEGAGEGDCVTDEVRRTGVVELLARGGRGVDGVLRRGEADAVADRGAAEGAKALPLLSATTAPDRLARMRSVRPWQDFSWVFSACGAHETTAPHLLQTLTRHLGKSLSRKG